VARILSFPFRFTPSGQVATVEQGSEQADREQIAVLCLTVTGERPLAPSFGITDPMFSTVEPSEIKAGVAAHGPDVEVLDVQVTQESLTTVVVDVEFA
jgi:hypothetical protein